ncbi:MULTISPECIES: hypothetical protein [Caballeronia]|jgi:hypothetical protein|uniref:Uncharacterized protein n=1 Tax=Caballeronia zhejiangensis TaxID=871203 RepID=A0A656QN29_9BURK|nr:MULTISPECIES: hypothetical protein [Caballeronia]EKS68976.1 hypothetical protein BURK_028140 [Burkholderia sp. SJ98]KDR32921.1 hypothetical protein BG60_12645 [Caballeronia zhejiangensis]MCG7399561.1 hypothetical protein [Caballeronia zhejiangensis]MCI1041917.1 hypothetical protein [Caballeronia zhejiangensis]MDR5763942.1 hypothetical protein [Caballeronia sp. LZ028]
MKRIVTHMLVATGLAIGAVGAAQAHSDLHIGVSLGAPAYVAPAPVYVRPAVPAYRAPYYRHEAPRWYGRDHRDYGRYDRAGWNHGGYGNNWGHRG